MKSSCPDAKPEAGEVQECLASHRPLLSWDCQEQLFRQEVENAEDLRLSVRLFRACLADKKEGAPLVHAHATILSVNICCVRRPAVQEGTPSLCCTWVTDAGPEVH